METLKVAAPKVVVVYEGKDISAHVAPALVDLTYVDLAEGERFRRYGPWRDAERRWQDAWYPQHGDVVQVQLGFAGEPLLPCGEFEVDEVELEGPPDVIRIRRWPLA